MPFSLRLGGAGVIAFAAALLLGPSPVRAQTDDLCGAPKSGEVCRLGDGTHTPGGGALVSHKGWPGITGIIWRVLDNRGHSRTGTAFNDELLGHHGSDTVSGGAGNDVLWGDWEKNNPWGQTDVMYGGDGNDWIYPSHGLNRMFGGRGNDRIIAYYGHGTIDCGPGTHDYAQVRENGAYKVKNCELIRHFCQFGSLPNGDCKKPGDAVVAKPTGQADQAALLTRLVAW